MKTLYSASMSDPTQWRMIFGKKEFMLLIGSTLLFSSIAVGVILYLDDDLIWSSSSNSGPKIQRVRPREDKDEPSDEEPADVSEEAVLKRKLAKVYKDCNYFEQLLWPNLAHPGMIIPQRLISVMTENQVTLSRLSTM